MSNVRDVGYFESHADYQTQRDFRVYFWRVVKGYRDVCELSPLVAATLDPNEMPKKLGADGIIYICDIEIATRRALDNNSELLDQWQRLVNGENTPNSASIINKCGRMYCRRRLAPATYLRFVKKGRRDRRRTVN